MDTHLRRSSKQLTHVPGMFVGAGCERKRAWARAACFADVVAHTSVCVAMRFLSYETQVARSGVRVLVRKLTDSAVLIRGEQLWSNAGASGIASARPSSWCTHTSANRTFE